MQPGTLELGERVSLEPVLASDIVRLNYSATFQQFLAPTHSNFSFERLTFDFGNQFALYPGSTRLLRPIASNGPDECGLDPTDHPACPSPNVRNLEGTIGFRVLASLSMTPGGDVVPFYFQPTLGGDDINGNEALGSYQDYRFRAPDLLLTQETFEHSIWKYPVGVMVMAEEGKLSLTRGSLGGGNWLHSFSAGLTLRAGGCPQVSLLFSWGGNEGTHAIASMNTSLLGGSLRPSLY